VVEKVESMRETPTERIQCDQTSVYYSDGRQRRTWFCNQASSQIISLTLPPILRGRMFAFACIAGGFIVACTIFALLVPLGPEVSLSDIARQMDAMHRSKPIHTISDETKRAMQPGGH
jgi:hypothetical protein